MASTAISTVTNLHRVRVVDGVAELAGTRVPLPRQAVAAEVADTVTVGFRPESLEPVASATQDAFAVTVNLVEELGSDAFCYGTLAGHDATHGEVDIIARVDPRDPPVKGEQIHLQIRPGEEHVFSATTGERFPG